MGKKRINNLGQLLCKYLALVSVYVAAWPIYAEQVIKTPDYHVHYSAFNSMLLTPAAAQTHQLIRSPNRALVTISVLNAKTKQPVDAIVQGTRTNLLGQLYNMTFKPIRESQALYYLNQFRYTENELWRFKLMIQSDPLKPAIPLNFNQRFYLEK